MKKPDIIDCGIMQRVPRMLVDARAPGLRIADGFVIATDTMAFTNTVKILIN